MGGKSSKQGFERGGELRQSQKKLFGNIKSKCQRISKDLKKYEKDKGDEDGEAREIIRGNITEVRDMLQKVSPELKEKYRNVFDKYVTKCEDLEMQFNGGKLNDSALDIYEPLKNKVIKTNDDEVSTKDMSEENKTEQIAAPKSPTSLLSIPEEKEEEDFGENKKKKLKKHKSDKYQRRVSVEEECFDEIAMIRKEMAGLRDEILVFKGNRGDRVYSFLEESFLRFTNKLENIETHDLKQLKHEKKIALDYAKESLEVLTKLTSARNTTDINSTTEKNEVFTKVNTSNHNSIIPDEDNHDENIGDSNINNFKRILDDKLKRITMDTNRTTIGMLKNVYEEKRDVRRTLSSDGSKVCVPVDGLMASYSRNHSMVDGNESFVSEESVYEPIKLDDIPDINEILKNLDFDSNENLDRTKYRQTPI